MSIERVHVSTNQRIDVDDSIAMSELGFANTARVIRSSLGRGYGILQGGYMVRQDGVRVVTLRPVTAAMQAGISGEATALIDADTVLTFGPNTDGSGHARIDTVSLHYAETLDAIQNRIFVNPVDNSRASLATPTRRKGTATAVVTPGNAGLNPVAPDVPAGDLLIGYVRVEANATQINADKITNANDDRRKLLYSGTVPFASRVLGVQSDELFRLVATDTDRIFCTGTIDLLVTDEATVGVPLQCVAEDTLTGSGVALGYGIVPDEETHFTIPICGLVTAGVVVGLEQRIKLRVSRQAGAGGSISWQATMSAFVVG